MPAIVARRRPGADPRPGTRRRARRDGTRSVPGFSPGRHAPADELAAKIVRGALAGRAVNAAPAGQPALVRHEREVARVLGRIAAAAVTRVVAMDPVLAGARRRGRRRPDHARRECAAIDHRAPRAGSVSSTNLTLPKNR